MIIKTRNTLTDTAPKTFLTHPESAGTNVLRWQNANAFKASWGIQVGETSEEQTEIMVLGVATPAGTAGTLTGNTLYEHPANTPIYATKYDQLVFKCSTTGTAGTAIALANGTITIQADNEYTQFDDTSGSITYAYKTNFRSSVLGANTSDSDWITISPPFYSLMNLRQRVKDKLWDSRFVTDPQIDDWLNEWLDEMNNTMVDVNEDYALGSVNVTFSGTNDLGTITSSDFKTIRRVWLTSNGEDWYNASKMSINQFVPDQEFNETSPYYFMYGDNIVGRRPNNSDGTASIIFYKLQPHLDNDLDEIPVPMKAYTKSFVDYALAQALYKDNQTAGGDGKVLQAEAAKARFQKELTPRLRSGQTYMEIVEDVGQEDAGVLET